MKNVRSLCSTLYKATVCLRRSLLAVQDYKCMHYLQYILTEQNIILALEVKAKTKIYEKLLAACKRYTVLEKSNGTP